MTHPSKIDVQGLIAPRLQLRWEQEGEVSWLCHYELVLPLREHDIRRETDEDLPDISELVVPMKAPTRRGTSREPCAPWEGTDLVFDAPYRDGAHAHWDAETLGYLPIFVITPDGTALRDPKEPTPTKALQAQGETE